MPRPARHPNLLLLPAAAALLAGCSITPQLPADFKVYEQEHFSAQAPYSRAMDASALQACQAARRALLGQGYFLYVEEPARLHGRKFFRPAAGTGVELAVNVTCLPAADSDARSVVYATAWQDAFVTRRNPIAASVGMPIMGNVSMPVATTDDALVKVGVETVLDPAYYARLFDRVAASLPGR